MAALGLYRSGGRRAVSAPLTLALGAGVLAWSAVLVNALFGIVPLAVPNITVVAAGVPVALCAAVLLRRDEAPAELRLAAGWSVLLVASLYSAISIPSEPLLGLGVIAVVACAALCARRPAAAVLTAFLLTGAYGSAEVFTPIPAGETVDLLLAGLWLAVIWSWFVSGRARRVWVWPGIVAGVLYIAVTAVGIAGAEDLYDGAYAFRASAWYMLAFLLVAYAGWGRETYRRIALGFVVVAGLVGAYATIQKIVGPSDRELKLALSVAPAFEIVDGRPRLFGSFPHGKELAAWTAVAIPFLFAVALMIGGRWRLMAAGAIGLCAVGLLGSQTRAALPAVVAGLALVLLLYHFARSAAGPRLGVTIAAVLALAGAGTVVFTQTAGESDATADRYRALITDPTGDPAYQARLYKWEDALDDLENKPFGNGLGSAGRTHERYGRFVSIASQDIDNSYLTIAYQQGFAVAGLYALSLILLVVGLARRAVASADRERAAHAIGGCGALVAFGVIMWSANFYEGLPALTAWLLFGLGAAQFAMSARAPEPAASR